MGEYYVNTINVRTALYEASQLLKEFVDRDTAITQLRMVCPPSQFKDVNLELLSTEEIEMASEYVRVGLSLSTALNFIHTYGKEGLEAYMKICNGQMFRKKE